MLEIDYNPFTEIIKIPVFNHMTSGVITFDLKEI